ncbi:MAG: hypothetical protein A3G32_07270 [Deltaproteobacteria bacterium RIFCSPLOWO2_12_FULL_40_28]|nr:MAG: hypothetical protein A3C45_07315 [Deltaproteobacteria bacterium RIFCSPHIGHO2_02_FULL_40_28]OGQ19244.1 MAG: hypothetical protein A3E27_04500 [Deltaproteobacteria bacterium RIFCSPHIGHO2_12_FULL_40_32]OGQ40533.1 MAG: hypothetical protein A3I69_00570 [Deltaproteobacteria bacterium RIFCSPLOWO2_02_FULL_40_36]OGQ53768.1 MAG: hypothetical protein A3G32_07270 [Deltaproteobacteria bacterium RIFCSPLOWO2_12_FULL_40_28]
MTQPKSVLKKLKTLKNDLNISANRFWSLRLALSQAYRQGHEEKDFLPRRLKKLSLNEKNTFDFLLNQLHEVLADQFENPFFVLSSDKDLKAWLKIRQTIRYIKNSFSNTYPITHTLVKLNKSLPYL